MSTNVERKFLSLRKRLDQFGYRQPLGIESLPLVDKLFSDLIYTTENFRKAKLSAGKTEKDSRNVDALLEPYKTDNARLVRENNELHQGLLKLMEEKERVTRELKAYVRKLDHDSSDLKFLNNQYVHKVRCLEKDSKTKSERIQQLQEKNMQAVIATPGGKKHSIAFRRQRMQIDGLVPPSENSAYPVTQPDDPYIADLLQLADGRIQELQDDIIKVKLDVERAEECVKHLNTQVEERDKEIDRLNRALDGGRPHDVISLEAQTVSNEKLIAHLNLQIEYLQEANRTLEKQVEGLLKKKKDASSEVADLSVKNQELCEELTHIDHLAKQMEIDRERVLETADVELLEARKEIQRLRQAPEDLEDIIAKLRREQSEGDYEKDRLRDQLAQVKEQEEKMEGLMNFLEEEKRRLQDKVEKMTAADRELVLELEAMRVKYGVCGKERSPSRLDAFVRSLEEERDYYRHEADRYKRARGAGGLDGSPTRTPTRGRSPRARGDTVEKELARVVRERDELRAALLSFEKQMEDIQTNARTLTAERDQLRAQHTHMQDELTQARNSAEDDAAGLKDEREQADRELQQVTSERDALREHLKDSIEGNAESKELEETVRSLSEDIKKANEIIKKLLGENKELARKNKLKNAVSVSQEKVLQETEETLKARSSALAHSAEEMAQQRAESNALRLLQEQMERSLCDIQHRLSVKSSELQAACQQIHKLEERIGELSVQGSEHKEKVSSLQRSIVALDKEKDTLQDEVDHKTERLVELQQELDKKENTLEEVRITVRNLDNSLDQLKGTLSSRDREVGSLRRQLDTAQEELTRLTRDRDVARTENRRLQDDLATMTRENQAVHAEMDEALHEKDELKARVHSYIIEVARVEKLMAVKEQENRDMLERFRLAHTEVEERDQQIQQAEGLNNSIRLELLSSDTERRRLREATSNQERELQQHIQALQAYEAQVSSLVRGRSRLEEEAQAARRAEASALADLASVRELCVKLDSGKELTVRQLTSKSMELERLSGELDDVRSEAELLKKQLASERVTVRNLEALLSTNRQKEFQTHLSASERESELKILRDRLVLADSKTASHAKEVSQLRGKVSQLQTEMDVLKRQLTTERFERERAIQEMRKQGVSFSSLRSSSPLSVSLSPRPASQEHSILRTPDRSTDKSTDKNVSFKE